MAGETNAGIDTGAATTDSNGVKDELLKDLTRKFETVYADSSRHCQACCWCWGWHVNPLSDGTSIREYLDIIGEYVRDAKPSDATKQLAKDLQDLEKEYGHFKKVVEKYEEEFIKYTCEIGEMKRQCENLATSVDQLDPKIRKSIETIWSRYEAKEQNYRNNWWDKRFRFNDLQTCVDQARLKAGDAATNFGAIKGFADTVGARFKDLDDLYNQADGQKDNLNAVYARYIEFHKVKGNLSFVPYLNAKAPYDATKCPTDCGTNLLETREPKWFRQELHQKLKDLIFDKFDAFLWHQSWIETADELTQSKGILDSYKKGRRERFVQEAEDAEPDKSNDTPPTAQEIGMGNPPAGDQDPDGEGPNGEGDHVGAAAGDRPRGGND